MSESVHTSIDVRDVAMKLMTYTRSLELCARMNYETENLDFIDSIAPGEIFYDLGACEGRFSIYAGLKGITIFAFEPEAKNYSVFRENIELNELKDNIKQLSVHPNPSTGSFFLSTDFRSNTMINIFDMSGRKVHSTNVTPGQQVNAGHLENGIYLLTVQQGESTGKTLLVISK